MRRVLARCAELEQYTLTLTRQERLGLFRILRGPEQIRCWFRREPFSVRMKWLDPDVKYGESTFVRGEEGDRVRFIPRHGLFGLPPILTKVTLQMPVIWGESKYPLSDFGLERLMQRTLASIELSGDELVVEQLGRQTLASPRRVTEGLRLTYPQSKFPVPVQEIYFDVESGLPAMTVIKTADGQLDAFYRYDDVNVNVTLADDDFILDAERAQRADLVAGQARENEPQAGASEAAGGP
jgi:hypothetical protein